MREGLDTTRVGISNHAVDKWRLRSGQTELTRAEARRAMYYAIDQGQEGTRDDQDGQPQPVIRCEGWIFVVSHDGACVVTVFFNEHK